MSVQMYVKSRKIISEQLLVPFCLIGDVLFHESI